MSFGWSGSDVFLLAQLAWNTVQNARKACGEYDELTRETVRLHVVLQRLAQEVAKKESPVNRPGETSKEQLERIADDCEVVLKQLDQIVTAYASLGEEKRSARKIWQRVRFGNGQRADLGDLRSKLMSYTSEILLYLNLVSMSTVGRIEQRMNRDEGVLRDIKVAVEKKTAHAVLGANQESSVWTTYTSDDTGFWRGLRRDLVKDGLPSAAIHKHKHLIKKYVNELGARGILDESPSIETYRQQQDGCIDSEMTEEVEDLPDTCNADLNTPRKHDRHVVVEPLEDVNEQRLNDPTNPAPAKGIDVSFAVVPDVENDNGSSSETISSIVVSRGDLNSNDTFPSRNREHCSATYQHEPEKPIISGKSSEPPKNKACVGTPSSSRGEVQRSATYQPSHGAQHSSTQRSETKPIDGIWPKNPSPEVKHSSFQRSGTMPGARMRPVNPVPLKFTTDSSSESEAQHPETHQPPLRVKHPSVRRSETKPVDGMRFKNPSPGVKRSSIRRSETMPIDRKRPSNPVPLRASRLKNMETPSDTTDNSSESEAQRPEIHHPSSRVEHPSVRRSEMRPVHEIPFQNPLPRVNHPFIRRSETMPIDRKRPSNPVPKNMEAPSDTTNSSSEYEHDTSKVYNAPFKFGDIWICPSTGSIRDEATSSRQPQGSSPEDQLYDMTFQFNFKYKRQIMDLKQCPFNSKRWRDCGYLVGTIREYIISIEEVNVEDEVLRGKKEELIGDAEREIRELDSTFWLEYLA